MRTANARLHKLHASPRKPKVSARAQKPVDKPNQRYTPDQFINALKRTRGMVSMAAHILGCDRGTIYDAMKTYPEIKETVDSAREIQLDTTELKLFTAIDKGEPWAITLYLKTMGRKRGYVEKVDVGADAATLEELVLMAHKRPADREQKPKEGHA